MVKTDFSDVITNPFNLDQLPVSEIQEVIREFPYFSAAHLLLAKKLKEEDSLSYEKQLNLTAAYVPSRKVLYNLIHNDERKWEATFEQHADDAAEFIVPTPAIEATLLETVEEDELDKLIRSQAAQNYVFDPEPEEKKPEQKSRLIPELPENQKLEFSGWLEYFEGHRIDPLDIQHKIIDEFIQREPEIAIKVPADAPVHNLARDSSRDMNDEMVTETLAKIHLDQGNRTKAIEIYERLKLKYPEKSAYFAAQIEFIKQK
jgi:hypothetical protein